MLHNKFVPSRNSIDLAITFQVTLSRNIPIENGLKLMEHCFQKHIVNLDPSSGQSKTSTVYRPIDKYMNVLPFLCGSKKWTEKWHVGLLSDVASHAESEQYVESVEPSSSFQQSNLSELGQPGSSLMASQDSLAKSNSSIGDQMVINKPGELFGDNDETTSSANLGALSNFFQPQLEQRKIVNLFDDEPPSLEPSPIVERKPVNLFDDYESVDSFPELSTPENVIREKQQPVDLFNDREFDNFIKKIEAPPGSSDVVVQGDSKDPEVISARDRLHPNMTKINEEIKQKVHLKKFDEVVKPNKAIHVPIKKNEPEKVVQVIETKPRLKKVTNLFDDDDEEDDYFEAIVKQKAARRVPTAVETKSSLTAKTKLTNLFDDEDDDKTFDKIFSKNSNVNSFPPDVGEPTKLNKNPNSLFDDDEHSLFVQSEPPKIKEISPEISETESLVVMLEEVVDFESIPEPKKKDVELATTSIFKENKIFSEVSLSLPPDDEPQVIPQEIVDSSLQIGKSAKTEALKQILNSTLPFLNDEPPDDDDSWETEYNFEEPEPVLRPKSVNYPIPVVPIFDDVPPDDDDFVIDSLESPPTELVSDEDEINILPVKPKIELSKDATVDELDRSVTPASIKSKLNIFNRTVEESTSVTSPKKPLPGKLNTNLRINVSALMPGARLPTRETADLHEFGEPADENLAETSSVVSNTDSNNNSSLLNNDLVKSRARIQVKRRPSTRIGRQANYHKSTNEEIEKEVEKLNRESTVITSSKNLAQSFFDDIDDDDEIINERQQPSTQPSTKVVTTNKISVFYDDEEDTRIIVEQRKLNQQAKLKVNNPNSTIGLFDDVEEDFLGKSATKNTFEKVEQSRDSRSVFYEESYDDLFASKKTVEPAKPTPNSLFDDEDDDLFKSVKKKTLGLGAATSMSSSGKLFESDDEAEPFATGSRKLLKVEQPKKQTLFGDDDSDDDDLFSSKPKCMKLLLRKFDKNNNNKSFIYNFSINEGNFISKESRYDR